jgi:ATP-binding cassette subfamily B protein
MWASLRIGYGLGADIGGNVYHRILHQSYSWHVNNNSSEVIAALDKVNTVTHGIITPVIQGLAALIISTGLLVLLLLIDTLSALFAGLFFSILYAIASIVLRQKLTTNDKKITYNLSRRIQAVQEGLGGIKDVILDGTQKQYHSRFTELDYMVRRCQAENSLIAASPRFIIEALGMVFIVILASWLAAEGKGLAAALPILGALALGAQKLLPQMQTIYQSWSSIKGAHNQLRDISDFLERTVTDDSNLANIKVDGERHENDKSKAPLMEFDTVSFKYRKELDEVLRSINIEIKRGDRIGLIGTTGSGKSTLIDLIMGLFVPTSGTIKIEGKLLNDLNRKAWQNKIAHVPQSIFLADASIAENIAFGVHKTQIDMNRIRSAAEQAELKSFIESLPDDYRTSVGERGVRLSGGQRQRIGLARALYKRAEILILLLSMLNV